MRRAHLAGVLQQANGAHDIGELVAHRVMQGGSHTGQGGEMHYRVEGLLREQVLTDVALVELAPLGQ